MNLRGFHVEAFFVFYSLHIPVFKSLTLINVKIGIAKEVLYVYIYDIYYVQMDMILQTKLTLSVDEDLVEQAKAIAKDRKVSLSKLVEYFFESLRDSSEVQLDPRLEKSQGKYELDKSIDLDDLKMAHLWKKHIK